MRATWKRCAPRRKVIPHYDTVSNNAGDEDKLFRRRGDVESRPPACPRLKLGYQVAFKWVCRVIKVDKTLLPSPSVHLLTDICRTFRRGTDHNWDLVLLGVWFCFFFAALLITQDKIMYIFSYFWRFFFHTINVSLMHRNTFNISFYFALMQSEVSCSGVCLKFMKQHKPSHSFIPVQKIWKTKQKQ